MHALSHILSKTGATIVLSSTWRMDPAACSDILRNFHEYAKQFGGPLDHITEISETTSPFMHSYRQWEIHDWLSRMPGGGTAVRWVAIDDEELLEGPHHAKFRQMFEGHVVKCESQAGLSMELANEVVELLERQRHEDTR